MKVNRGNYHFTVSADEHKLPLEVNVAQQATYQTEFTTDQPNMQGNSKSTFTFSATLKNQTADQQLYALMANAPRGWNVIFKPNYNDDCQSGGKGFKSVANGILFSGYQLPKAYLGVDATGAERVIQ